MKASTPLEARRLLDKHSVTIDWLVSEVIIDWEDWEIENGVILNASDEPDETISLDDYINDLIYTNDLNNVLVYLAKKRGIEVQLGRNGLISGRRLTNAVKRICEIDNPKWTTKVKRVGKNSLRFYPGLKGNGLYWDTLDELSKDEDYDYIGVKHTI